jgi:myb proto-oncogene protein
VASSPESDDTSSKKRSKTNWTTEEDEQLRQLVHELGTRRWSEIAKAIPGRKGKQCRERWVNHLIGNMQKGGWTESEDETLMRYVNEIGTKWTTIAKMLPGWFVFCLLGLIFFFSLFFL